MHHPGRQNQVGRARNTQRATLRAVNLNATMTTTSYEDRGYPPATSTSPASRGRGIDIRPGALPVPVNCELIRGRYHHGARGVKACDFVAALGDENRGVARRRRVTLVRASP